MKKSKKNINLLIGKAEKLSKRWYDSKYNP